MYGRYSDVGWLELDSRDPTTVGDTELRLAGYFEPDFGTQLYASLPCRMHGHDPRDNRVSLTDCPATHGTSGAPIFIVEQGTLKVVSMMTAAYDTYLAGLQPKYSMATANVGYDVQALLWELPGLTKALHSDIADNMMESNPSQRIPVSF